MDAVEATYVFQDWELLPTDSDPDSPSDRKISFDESHSGALLRANHFSLDAHAPIQDSDDAEKSPTVDDAGNWINPRFEENPKRSLDNDSGEPPLDTGSQLSEDRIYTSLKNRTEMGFYKRVPEAVNSEGIQRIVEEKVENPGGHLRTAGTVETSGNVNLRGENEIIVARRNGNEKIVSGGDKGVGDSGSGKKVPRDIEKKSIAWWKMPMELIKYCACRMNPALTVSVAAAVMGIALLSHRLYKMKKKTSGLKIKVTVNDKKASLTMSRAARLNEAFSVVKRVPMIRTSLHAGGATTNWPVMSSR
ncbi:uncharacterized protein LOC127246334 [Andrographis paniculata]|uniref:uncharacterized protein LOC127246334 n=1 Tax=Andrographis paniculata TaxID=175694 RepID=UPI0021E72890|nr:uncharacterized protein LOC127246334 [Andrographis paniculata]